MQTSFSPAAKRIGRDRPAHGRDDLMIRTQREANITIGDSSRAGYRDFTNTSSGKGELSP